MKGEYEYEHERDAQDHEAEFMKDELNIHDVDYARALLKELHIDEQRGYLDHFLEYVEDWGCAMDAWTENLDDTLRNGHEEVLRDTIVDLLKTHQAVKARQSTQIVKEK